MIVEISSRAKDDIRKNAAWWATNHDRSQAEKWFYCVYDQLEAIGNAPFSYGLSAENGSIPMELREALVGLGGRRGYRAVFVVREGRVIVLRVVRAAEDRLNRDDLL